MDWDPKINKDPVEKKAWLASSKNTFGFKDEVKQTVSSSLQNTLSNYFFEVESPDDQVYSKQTRNNKQSKKQKGKQKLCPGNRKVYPQQRRENVAVLIHT
jgi:hypothetical protein